MNKELQDTFRADVIKSYQARAFECLGNYSYYGDHYSMIEKQVKGYEDRIAAATAEFTALDHSVPENREKRKVLKAEIDELERAIKQVEPVMKKHYENVIKWREEGVRLLEQVEHFKTFVLKTPEEIDAAKKAAEVPVAAPVVAGETKE